MSLRRSDVEILGAVAGSHPSPDGWQRGNCPRCEVKVGKADRKRCLGLHVPTGKWVCHRCGSRGYVRQTPEALADAAARAAPEARRTAAAMERPPGFWFLFDGGPGSTAGSTAAARRYLTAPPARGGRGLDPAVLRDARVGACVTGPFVGRVVVPVLGTELDEDGEEVWFGWSSRAWVKDSEVGYKYPAGMALSELIYNPAALHVVTDVPLMVVEGVFDAHALWPNACATLGGTRDPHLVALGEARRPVVMVPDGDAWEKGWIAAMRLRLEGARAGALKLPARVDPDEIPRDVLERAALASLDQDLVRL